MQPFARRAERARILAERRPEAREALSFYAEVASFQNDVDPENPLASLSRLLAFVRARGPEPLKVEAARLDEKSCRSAIESYLALEDMRSPRSFFARVLLQPAADETRTAGTASAGCPRCGHPPQVGCLRPASDGTSLSLVCSLRFHEWPGRRGRCTRCGEAVSFHEASDIPHIRVQTCEACRRYLHLVRLDVDREAIPEVDEMAALSLDVWARVNGFEKIFPNLVGI